MALTQEQQILLDQLNEDVEVYRSELKSQIKKTTILSYVGLVAAVIVGILFYKEPEFVKLVKELTANMDYITGLIGEVIPIALASKSYNSMKGQKKKLKGLRTFEKAIERMRMDLIPNTKEQILLLEDDFAEYIIT